MPGGPLFWGSILVRSVRIGGPFWGSILVPVVRFGAPFSASFLDLLWLRGASVLDLLWLPGPRFWTSSGFGPALASGGSFLNLRWLPGARFWASIGFGGSFLDVLLRVRAWTFAPYHFRIPLYMFQVIKPSLFASLAFVFPFAPPSTSRTRTAS